MKLKKGDSLRVYTDGERIYLDSFELPVIWPLSYGDET